MKKKTRINSIVDKLESIIKWCNEMGKSLFWLGIIFFVIFIVFTMLGI